MNPDHKKSPLYSSLFKAALLIGPLVFCFGGSTVVKGDRDPLSIGAVRPGTLGHRTDSAQGYVKVYSMSDEFNDGAYYANSSYAIYSIDGSLLRGLRITLRALTK
jgi:hypothetical protein